MGTEDHTFYGHWTTPAEAHEFARWVLNTQPKVVKARVHLDREIIGYGLREWAVTVTEVAV